MKKIFSSFFLALFLLTASKSQAQAPAISYLIPDIGSPATSTYIEIIAPYNRRGTYGPDSVYANNPGDAVRVICSNPSDSLKLTWGPIIVSWQGRVISTQVMVSACPVPSSTIWSQVGPEFSIPLNVIINGVASNSDTFFIVQPNLPLVATGGGVFGSGSQWGVRSKRGALIFDSISLGAGTYTVSTTDCDPSTMGNQAYLPISIRSLGDVSLSAGAILSVNAAAVRNAGPGGGGGSLGDGPVIDSGGYGFVGGSPGESGFGALCPATGGTGTGGYGSVNAGGIGLNGIIQEPSDALPQCEYYGGTGNPFIPEGGGVVTYSKHEGDGNGGGFGTVGEDGRGERGNFPDVGGIVNGNPMLVPLMGGSGGGGGNEFCACDEDNSATGACGGGGGGAICLSAAQINAANGSVQSNGGTGLTGGAGCVGHSSVGGCGSGGGITIESKLNGNFPSVSAAGGISSHNHNQAGNGGSGRIRLDGPLSNAPALTPPTASNYRGLSTDTSHYPVSSLTLHGSGDGDSIRIYSKSGNNPWLLNGTIGGYIQNAWTYQLAIDTTKATYIVAMQRRMNPSTDTATREPSWVMSQAAANILSKAVSGGNTIFSLSGVSREFLLAGCGPKDTTAPLSVIGCGTGILDSAWFTGSQTISLIDGRRIPRPIGVSDSLLVQYNPLDSGTDSAVLHLRYDLGSGPHDTTIVVVGTNHNAPPKLTLSTISQKIVDEICNGKDTSIGLGLLGCGGAGGTLDSLWMTGSLAIGIASSRVFPQSLGASDSVRLQYNPSPSGNDTSYLHIRYDGGSGAKDTIVRVIGTLDSSLRGVTLSMPTSPVMVESGCMPITIPNPLELLGCTASGGRLDTEWITGSPAITVGDARSFPHGIGNFDSLPLRYLPDGNPSDTSIVHFRYTVGTTTHDTTLTVIGRIANPLPPRVLALPASPQNILTTTCGAQDSTMTIGIKGCPLGTGTIDSVWLTGSNTIVVNDSRSTPRTLQETDSLQLEYNPNGAGIDTSELHIRYDIGSGPIDTTIEVIGTVASPLVSAPASLHRESASAYYGGVDSLTLQLDLAGGTNMDSLWNTVSDIAGTVAFDPSIVGVVNYLAPAPWKLVSFTVHPSSFDFEIKTTPGKSKNAFDLGTALFRPKTTAVAASWIALTKLLVTIGTRQYALCVTENEDNHWAVKTLGEPVDAVRNEATAKDITIYPNPAENEIMIANPNRSDVTIELYDAIGRSLLTKNIPGTSNGTIDLEGWASGPYFIVARIGGKTETRCFLKQ